MGSTLHVQAARSIRRAQHAHSELGCFAHRGKIGIGLLIYLTNMHLYLLHKQTPNWKSQFCWDPDCATGWHKGRAESLFYVSPISCARASIRLAAPGSAWLSEHAHVYVLVATLSR